MSTPPLSLTSALSQITQAQQRETSKIAQAAQGINQAFTAPDRAAERAPERALERAPEADVVARENRIAAATDTAAREALTAPESTQRQSDAAQAVMDLITSSNAYKTALAAQAVVQDVQQELPAALAKRIDA